jgi:hypothetical protein
MRTLRRLKWPLLLCAVGLGLSGWLIASLFASFAGHGISLLVPGVATFDITETGKYTLWSQVEASFEGKLMTFPTGLPPGATIKIAKTADGATVPIQSKWPTLHRDSGGYIQVAIGTITFDAPGSYQIATEGLQEKRALYLDRFDFSTFFEKLAFGFIGPAVFMAGLVWGIVLFVSRCKRPNQALQPTAGRREAHI